MISKIVGVFPGGYIVPTSSPLQPHVFDCTSVEEVVLKITPPVYISAVTQVVEPSTPLI